MKTDIKNRQDIDRLMRSFYSKAMTDDIIGYIFTDVVKLDLKHHLPVIGDFWETIVFQNPVYAKRGRNPLDVHGKISEMTPLLPEHFARWLEIFTETTDHMFTGARADFIKMRAEAVATRMLQYVGGMESGKLSVPSAA